jgi:hypothetical protein
VSACEAASGTNEDSARAAEALIDAYAKVPHDDLVTWWGIRATAARLRGRSRPDLADRLDGVLNARLDVIARAF